MSLSGLSRKFHFFRYSIRLEDVCAIYGVQGTFKRWHYLANKSNRIDSWHQLALQIRDWNLAALMVQLGRELTWGAFTFKCCRNKKALG